MPLGTSRDDQTGLPRSIDLGDGDLFEQAASYGTQLADEVAACVDAYLYLFRVWLGWAEAEIRAFGRRHGDALRHLGHIAGHAWRPFDLITTIADAAAVDVELLLALNARTEVIARSECSVWALTALQRPFMAQNWDWASGPELDPIVVRWGGQDPAEHAFLSLQEPGQLAKIGINDSGVGVALNMLRHRTPPEDADPWVAVHEVLFAILRFCASVDEAATLIASTPFSGPSTITVVDAEEVAICEVTSQGTDIRRATSGAHTNHFTSRRFRSQDGDEDRKSSHGRFDQLDRSRPRTMRASFDLLCSHDDEHPLCIHPHQPHHRFPDATAAFVGLDIGRRTLVTTVGRPCAGNTYEFAVS